MSIAYFLLSIYLVMLQGAQSDKKGTGFPIPFPATVLYNIYAFTEISRLSVALAFSKMSFNSLPLS